MSPTQPSAAPETTDTIVMIGFVLAFACGMGAAVLLAQYGYPWLSLVALLVCGSIRIKHGYGKKAKPHATSP